MIRGYCQFDNCEDPIRSTGLCNKHYLVFLKQVGSVESQEKVCWIAECSSLPRTKGLCEKHNTQIRVHGHIFTEEELAQMRKEKHANRKQPSGWRWKEEDRNKQSERLKGRTLNTGRTHFKKGKESWNKGKTDWITETHREAIRRANTGNTYTLGRKKPGQLGENNSQWKGDEVSYRSLHKWVARHKGTPNTCEHCGESGLSGRQIHWSNISGEYKRNLDDWQRLCASCHGAYDSGKLTLAEIRG